MLKIVETSSGDHAYKIDTSFKLSQLSKQDKQEKKKKILESKWQDNKISFSDSEN